jgi:hypothetical protein
LDLAAADRTETEGGRMNSPALKQSKGVQRDEHLERVGERISGAVLDFCRGVRRFHMNELTDWVSKRTGVAPDSPGRILRQLRSVGKLNYRVLDRRASLYEVTRLEPHQERLF